MGTRPSRVAGASWCGQCGAQFADRFRHHHADHRLRGGRRGRVRRRRRRRTARAARACVRERGPTAAMVSHHRGRPARSGLVQDLTRPVSTAARTSGTRCCGRRPAVGHLLGGGLERHQEVGRDPGGRVVGGAIGGRDSSIGSIPSLVASVRASSSAAGVLPATAAPAPGQHVTPASAVNAISVVQREPVRGEQSRAVAPEQCPTGGPAERDEARHRGDLGIRDAQQHRVDGLAAAGAGRRFSERCSSTTAGLAARSVPDVSAGLMKRDRRPVGGPTMRARSRRLALWG